ncbi:MAG: phosphoenolpyruvate--protein phosphotransferase [Firmicutes bacterium HGW-Firmicutes-1]|nr:MAG: phosphoenolpyruvate--protein phosphotransferase [Firmicutes bacterium HGW-Firmicutes-1]
MIEIKGIPASSGIAIGSVMIKKELINPSLQKIADIDQEKKRFKDARSNAMKHLYALYESTMVKIGEKEASIFAAHIALIEDEELIIGVETSIETNSWNAEWALKLTTDYYISIFNQMDDPYLKERALDIKDISNRLQRQLNGMGEEEEMMKTDEPVIIVAHDLTPSDTAQMDTSKVLGFITEIGGKTSHTAILARTLEIPAIVGLHGIVSKVKNDQHLVLDGRDGMVYIEADQSMIQHFHDEKTKEQQYKKNLSQLKYTKAITKDGIEIELVANIGTPEDVKNILDKNVHGIGLFRTEFIYMSRDTLPTEEEQFEAYKKVTEDMKGHPVVIRTLDIGGDKELKYLEIEKEMNPFLGFRAIRLCLERVELWKTQLRAILRASAEVKKELTEENIAFNQELEVGMMMETPAAAIMADVFAKEVDFFSIGTNDLIQYTIAVDRMNPLVSHLYSPYDPAVIRLIKKIIDAGHQEGIWVGMCGEAASDQKAIPLWLGMGLDEFSMSASAILESKWLIQNISKKDSETLCERIMLLNTAADIEEALRKNIDPMK